MLRRSKRQVATCSVAPLKAPLSLFARCSADLPVLVASSNAGLGSLLLLPAPVGLRNSEFPIGRPETVPPREAGKTCIVEATAESLLQNSRAVIKIDCGISTQS